MSIGDPELAALVLDDGAVLADEVLESRPWVGDAPVRDAGGLPVRVRTTDPAMARHLGRLFAAFPVLGAGADGPVAAVTFSLFTYGDTGGRVWALYADGERIAYRKTPASVIAMLLWECNRRVIRAAVTDRVVLHAGCVARDGRAVVLAAPMESGKTTLVTALLDRGLDYLSDETAMLAPGDLGLRPYPKPLGVDDGSWPLFPRLEPDADAAAFQDRQWHVPPGAVGAGGVASAATPTLVLAPSYTPGGTTALSPVRPAVMLGLLAESTFHLSEQPARDLRVLARLVESTTCRRLEVADLGTACDLILGLLERP